MIESGQMQSSVQDEDLYFNRQWMAQALRLPGRRVERNREVPGALALMSVASLELPRHRRKRENIGRDILPPKLPVEFPDALVTRKQYGN